MYKKGFWVIGIILVIFVLIIAAKYAYNGQTEKVIHKAETTKVGEEASETIDVYKDFIWTGPYLNAKLWQRVTDPGATNKDAEWFLPNPVNGIELENLDRAVKVEIIIEMWGGHAGTSDKKFRINNTEWINIPETEGIGPGRPESYLQFRYPAVEIPLEQLKEGVNTFEFSCGKQVTHNFGWGQWALTGVIFRVYYSELDTSLRASITGLKSDSSIKDRVVLGIDCDKPELIKRVDYIGCYEDFDYNGNGFYRDWQYSYRHGMIQNHIGSAQKTPFEVEWDTSWLPDQDKKIEVIAVITDVNGFSFITPKVTGVELSRENYSVVMYKPYDVPERWNSRANQKKGCKIYVNYGLKNALEAKMVFATFNGDQSDEIGINGEKIIEKIGLNHDYSCDAVEVPIALVKEGINEFYTYSTTKEHGIEVMWPGIALKVKYDTVKKNLTDLGTQPSPTPIPTAKPAPITTEETDNSVIMIFGASDDSSVIKARSTENCGKDNTIGLFNTEEFIKEGYIKFNVERLKGKIEKVLIKLYYTGKGSGDISGSTEVWATDANWDENIITWDDRPEDIIKVAEYDNPDKFPQWVTIDVTHHINSDGIYSFRFSTDCKVRTTFAAKENSEGIRPILEIMYEK